MENVESDQYLDLEELSDHPSTSSFDHAANHLKSLVSKLDDQTLLTLYGYYKQGSEGPCNVPKPSWYDLRAKSKWEAWKKLGNMSKPEAQILYVETIKQIDPDYDSESGSVGTGHGNKVSLMADDEPVPYNQMTVIDHIKNGNVQQVERYLSNKANKLDKLDKLGLGLIHWASDSGHVDMIELLLESGSDINLCDSEGQTPLHYASSCGHKGCVEFLLAKGADKEIEDNDGCKPIDVAADEEVKGLLN